MTVPEILKETRGRTTVSFEFVPPSKSVTRSEYLKQLEPFMSYKPTFVNVTTHRNSVEVIENDKGFIGYQHTKHISTLHVCDSIAQRFSVPVVPHVLCGGFTRDETEDLLLDAHFLEIENLFAVRGDSLSIHKRYTPGKFENKNSPELIHQISCMNRGIYRDKWLKNPPKTNFCVGATFYPEKHIESPNMEQEFDLLKEKHHFGEVKFFISQMFFDNSVFYRYINEVSQNSETLWRDMLIPGIKVLTKESQVRNIPATFAVSIPSHLTKNFTSELGIEHSIEQCKDLIKNGFDHIHFFTSLNTDTLKVIDKL